MLLRGIHPYISNYQSPITNYRSLLPLLKEQASVMSAEAEGVTQGIADIAFLRFVKGEVHAIVDVLVQVFGVVVDGWRDDTVFEGHDASHSFYGSRRTDQVTGHRLGGIQVHVIDMIAEHPTEWRYRVC